MDKIHYIQSHSSVSILSKGHQLYKIDASLNPYIGCSHECLYCPHGHSSKIGVKTDFLHYLSEKLSAETRVLHLGLGTCCEPYGDVEGKHHIVRHALDIVMKHRFPVQILTKSDLITRDIKALKEYSQKGFAAISISLFTIDRKLARSIEPDLPSPQERLQLLRSLRKQGMFAGIVLAPVIPYLSDSFEQLEEVFKEVKRADGEYILPSVLSIHGPALYAQMKNYFSDSFPRIAHRFAGLYEHNVLPSATYCNRINDILDELSIKYSLPVYIPRINSQPDNAAIRYDILDAK